MISPPFEIFVPRPVHSAGLVNRSRVDRRANARDAEHPRAEAAKVEGGASREMLPESPTGIETAAPMEIETAAPVEIEAALRERAVQLAARACAQALRLAIARNPLFVARFVDDALKASGDPPDARVRLHPDDARASAHMIATDVIADNSIEKGQVVVEAGGARLGATIDDRALLLVRSASDE